MKSRTRTWCAYALVTIGGLRVFAHIARLDQLNGVAFATAASPLQLVFSHFRGFEPFSSRFDLELHLTGGSVHRTQITPELYAKLDGPYNRRNAYGLAIAFAPGLSAEHEQALWRDAISHGLCHGGPLAQAFEIPGPVTRMVIVVTTKTAGRDDVWRLQVECGP